MITVCTGIHSTHGEPLRMREKAVPFLQGWKWEEAAFQCVGVPSLWVGA